MVSLERCTFDSMIGCAFRTGSLGVHWFLGTRNDRWTDGGIHDGRAYGIREFGWKDEVIALWIDRATCMVGVYTFCNDRIDAHRP